MGPDRAAQFADRIDGCAMGDGAGMDRRAAIVDVRARLGTPVGGGSTVGSFSVDAAAPVFDAALLEACRALRVSLARTSTSAQVPNLIVLGVSPNTQCAQVAAGLAMAIAEEGVSTLLVDADFVSPSLHEPFGLPLTNGFAEALTAEVPVLVPARVGAFLSVLPAGRLRESETAGSIGSRVGVVARGLGERFANVVYYCSTTIERTVALLAAHVGGAVLVVRLGVDTADEVRATRDQLERAGIVVLGFAPVDVARPKRRSGG
jgi:Mrp family chromosome partitioning ATPase